ncbi:MAG: Gfo/Idh/MocA family oxidoreductase [Verrucomicrobiae bacterium]|nr:Gfo/Idh/MocA family oxidoreductase [Verrucomicrobiae bacterium]
MNPIGYGIIGAGFFGEKHLEVLSAMPGVEVLGLSRRSAGPLKEMASKYKVANTYTDYHELLANPKIEAVSITTHVDDHCQPAVDALKAGKHVFLEKPMANTVRECETILAAAKTARGKLMIGHICRFDTRVSQAREAVQAGKIGKIVSMHATRNLPARIGASVLDKIPALTGDGIHDTDIMMWLAGKVSTVYAQEVRVRKYKYADVGWAMYRFENGAVGVIETVWCLPDSTPYAIDARMEIIGTEGAIYIDCGNAGLTINDAQGMSKPDTAYWPELYGKRVGVLRHELAYFMDCVRANKAPEVITAEESRDAVAVMMAARKSADSGKVVDL